MIEETKFQELRAALMDGEQSGEATEFDFEAFSRRSVSRDRASRKR